MSSPAGPSLPKVVVVGSGVIGSVIAWRLAQRGCRVTLITGPWLGYAASHASAGMLAPVTETTFTDTALLPLNLESLRRWPDFAQELEKLSGEQVGLRTESTLSVAVTPDDAARLRDFAAFLESQGLDARMMTSRELRTAEPLLAPSVRSGLLVAADYSADNRMLWNALMAACREAEVEMNPGEVEAIVTEGDRAVGVRLRTGAVVRGDRIVMAAGSWAGEIESPVALPVRPVKGQSLRMHAGTLPQLTSTIRAFSHGFEVYLVPREHGELVVGATVEEQGFDARVTGEGAYSLLRDARAVVPITAEYEVCEFNVGWRPGTPDNSPILGESGVEGLVLAAGHYRNGILLTPITGDLIADVVCGEAIDPIAEEFSITRFQEDA